MYSLFLFVNRFLGAVNIVCPVRTYDVFEDECLLIFPPNIQFESLKFYSL